MPGVELKAENGMVAAGPGRRRRPPGRVPVDALAHEGLFLVLTNLRAANAASLYDLYFRGAGVKWRTAMRRLKDLVAAGYLTHLRLDGARCVYHLTPKSLALTPKLELFAHASLSTRPTDREAMYCWLRSALYAALTADGWTVGNNPAALFALRRYLIDTVQDDLGEAGYPWVRDGLSRTLKAMRAQTSLRVSEAEATAGARLRCRACKAVQASAAHEHPQTGEKCTGRLRAVPSTPLDIAWKNLGRRYDVRVLFIDDPCRPLEDQLRELSDVCFGAPVMRVLVRSTDPRSLFDPAAKKFVEEGARHHALMKAFEKGGALAGRVDVLDLFNQIQAYPLRLHGRRQ